LNCDTLRERLESYLDGELSEEDATGAGSHLAACAACRHQLEERQALRDFIRSRLPQAAPADLSASVLATAREFDRAGEKDAVTEETPLRVWFGQWRLERWIPALSGAAAVVLVLALQQQANRQTVPKAEAVARPFAHEATVVMLRYGEDPVHTVEPELTGLVLADPL
jgi:anti-sigma factor (TIGR02949 family)